MSQSDEDNDEYPLRFGAFNTFMVCLGIFLVVVLFGMWITK